MLQVAPAPRPQPNVNPKLERLAVLCALRERGIISDQAFLAQRRMLMGHDPLMLPAPAAQLAPSPAPKKKRRRGGALSIALLAVVGLGALWMGWCAWLAQRSTVVHLVPAPMAKADIHQDGVYRAGKAFRLGPYTYTVTGYRTAATLGSRQHSASPAGMTPYVVVSFTIRNDSNKARAVLTANLTLEDANGTLYRASSVTSAAPLMSSDQSEAWWDTIQPGAVTSLEAAFEVPAAWLKRPMKLVIVEEGLFGADDAAVYLNF